MKRKDSYVELTDQIYETLCQYRDDTGISSIRLFRHMKINNLLPPDSRLKSATLQSCFTRSTLSANRRDLDAVLSTYTAIAEADSGSHHNISRVPVDTTFVERLSSFFDENRYARQALLMRIDRPEGLNRAAIDRVLKGSDSRISRIHLDYLQRFIDR